MTLLVVHWVSVFVAVYFGIMSLRGTSNLPACLLLFPFTGSKKDSRARRCERRRRHTPAAEPVVQPRASRARECGAQHSVGARGHSQTGQALIPSIQGRHMCIMFN